MGKALLFQPFAFLRTNIPYACSVGVLSEPRVVHAGFQKVFAVMTCHQMGGKSLDTFFISARCNFWHTAATTGAASNRARSVLASGAGQCAVH